MADWLDTAFAVYDYGILGALHMAAERAGAAELALGRAAEDQNHRSFPPIARIRATATSARQRKYPARSPVMPPKFL